MKSLNSYYVGTVYPIGLYFETFFADYHINVQVQENLHYPVTSGIKRAQSWSKSGNFIIFAFFAIFNKLYNYLLRATFLYSRGPRAVQEFQVKLPLCGDFKLCALKKTLIFEAQYLNKDKT